MFGSKAHEPDLTAVSRFAYAAGTAGILANLLLIAMYALLGLPAYLGIPIWFVYLGRYLGASAV